MKKFIFMVVCLLGMAATASAQFANSKGGSSYDGNAGWKGLRIAYNPMSLTYDGGSEGFNGLSVGYVHGISVSQSAPVVVEVGGNVLYSFESDSELKMISVNVPVNVGYKFSLGEGMALYPHAGVNFRVNAWGEIGGEDLFGDYVEAKRFNFGWNAGVSAHFNKFVITASYGSDFTDFIEEVKIAMPILSVGFNF